MYLIAGMPVYEEEDSVSTENGPTPNLYPVHLHFLGPNLYRGTLYDVNGAPLVSRSGRHLSVYTPEIKDAFDNGELRFLHRVSPGYRFFITSVRQYNEFIQARNNHWMSPSPDMRFYIYEDDDCNYTDNHFNGSILNF